MPDTERSTRVVAFNSRDGLAPPFRGQENRGMEYGEFERPVESGEPFAGKAFQRTGTECAKAGSGGSGWWECRRTWRKVGLDHAGLGTPGLGSMSLFSSQPASDVHFSPPSVCPVAFIICLDSAPKTYLAEQLLRVSL